MSVEFPLLSTYIGGGGGQKWKSRTNRYPLCEVDLFFVFLFKTVFEILKNERPADIPCYFPYCLDSLPGFSISQTDQDDILSNWLYIQSIEPNYTELLSIHE